MPFKNVLPARNTRSGYNASAWVPPAGDRDLQDAGPKRYSPPLHRRRSSSLERRPIVTQPQQHVTPKQSGEAVSVRSEPTRSPSIIRRKVSSSLERQAVVTNHQNQAPTQSHKIVVMTGRNAIAEKASDSQRGIGQENTKEIDRPPGHRSKTASDIDNNSASARQHELNAMKAAAMDTFQQYSERYENLFQRILAENVVLQARLEKEQHRGDDLKSLIEELNKEKLLLQAFIQQEKADHSERESQLEKDNEMKVNGMMKDSARLQQQLWALQGQFNQEFHTWKIRVEQKESEISNLNARYRALEVRFKQELSVMQISFDRARADLLAECKRLERELFASTAASAKWREERDQASRRWMEQAEKFRQAGQLLNEGFSIIEGKEQKHAAPTENQLESRDNGSRTGEAVTVEVDVDKKNDSTPVERCGSV